MLKKAMASKQTRGQLSTLAAHLGEQREAILQWPRFGFHPMEYA